MVGRVLSLGDGPFSEALLNFRAMFSYPESHNLDERKEEDAMWVCPVTGLRDVIIEEVS